MKKLDVENSAEYEEANKTIKFLTVLKNYYSTDKNFDQLELEGIPLRELFGFMSDYGFPKKGFADKEKINEILLNIEIEIKKIQMNLKEARLQEIEERDLNSLLIMPSWSKIIGYKTKGFYLGHPVLDLKQDTIVMLSYDIMEVTDKLGNELALLTGPGILFTKFSIKPGSYIINAREINAILLPILELQKLLDAPSIFTTEIKSTLNELISIIPFNLIEEAYTKQAIIRGVMSRNVFHPNKDAFNTFIEFMSAKKTVNPNDGFKILSAHPAYFNRLLLTEPQRVDGADDSFNRSSAGIAAILDNGQKILDELIPDRKEQFDMLLKFKDMKFEFNTIGKSLIEDWIR